MADVEIRLAAQIVSAYLRNNELPVGEISNLISGTYAALLRTTSPVEPQVVSAQPAISIKKSISPDALSCLDCGKPQKMLKRHLMAAHGMTVDEYRSKWSLPSDYPMVAPNYALVRSDMAKKIGLGRKQETQVSKPGDAERETTGKGLSAHKYPASRWSKSSS